MQTTTRRSDPVQLRYAAIALAVAIGVVAVTLAAVMLQDGRSMETDQIVASRVVAADLPAFDYRFLEQNLELPTIGTAPAAVQSSETLFLEQNLYLPAAATSDAPDWRVIEENSWGEDFVFDAHGAGSLYPSVDDVPQRLSGQVRF